MLLVMKPLKPGGEQKPPKAEKAKGLKRTPISRRPGKRLKAKRVKTMDALDFYFEKFGWDRGEQRWGWCQLCGMPVVHAAGECDPCHKTRSWKGQHERKDILAGHRACHRWLDGKGSKGPREQHVLASSVSCETGGVVKWTEELWASLTKAINCEGLQQRQDFYAG